MKKVVLFGDSIRQIGYGLKVPELLGEEYDVWQPDDNCRFVKYTLRMLFEYQEELKQADVIHWNCGAWDLCTLFDDQPFTELDEYVTNILRVAELLKKYCPNVIFATTVPTRPERADHNVKRTKVYNAAVVDKLKAMGVVINDLFTPLAVDPARYICDDYIHLNEEGIEVCARMTADIIRKVLADK